MKLATAFGPAAWTRQPFGLEQDSEDAGVKIAHYEGRRSDLEGSLLTVLLTRKCPSFSFHPHHRWREGSGKMMIAVKGRLEALRRTKLYDLLAAAPIIAWLAFSMAQMLPELAQRVALVIVFLRTDPSVL